MRLLARVGAPILLASLACGLPPPPPCPRDMELLVPTEDPEVTVEYGDTGNLMKCGDEWRQPNAFRGTYVFLECTCGICAEEYVGRDYCVPMTTVHAWLARNCPRCRVDYRSYDNDPITVQIECTSPECGDNDE